MNQVRVSIIGAGYWGANYVRLFSELPRSEVAVVCDQSPDRLNEIGQRFPDVELTTDLQDALGRDDVDVAVVCTPATTHYQVAASCLIAGKHVLIEKPITTLATEADELVAMAEKRGLVLMVGHTFIHNGGVQKLKAYIEQREIGRPYYLYARRTNMGPIRRDVNALWDLAPHDISIFNYLLESTPKWVSAVGARVLGSPREDVGFISLGYPDGIIGHIHVSWAEPNKVREIVVVGSDKRLVFDDLNAMERVRVYEKGVRATVQEASNFGEYQFQMRDGDIISPRVDLSEPLKNQCNHFLDCIQDGLAPLTGGREGRDVVGVMEAVDRSIELNGAPVEVAPAVAVASYSLAGSAVRHSPGWRAQAGNGHPPGQNGTLPEAARAMMDAVERSINRQRDPIDENQGN